MRKDDFLNKYLTQLYLHEMGVILLGGHQKLLQDWLHFDAKD